MKYLFRVYQWLISVPILVVITICACIGAIVASLCGFKRWAGYYPSLIWSRCICALWFVRVKVVGRENLQSGKSYVFVANHQGAFDIWAISGYLGHQFRWLMKKGLEKVFLVGFTCRQVGNVFVDDSSIQGIKTTIADAEATLKDGMSVVIFPEGTRSHTGAMLPFKRGAFMLAAEFGLPVVPITISGSFKAMPRSTYNVTPTTITITIHKAIEPGEKGFNTRQLIADCRSAINSALPSEYADKQ